MALKSGGDPNGMAGLERMGQDMVEAMQMMGTKPTRDNRVQWFFEGMIVHHGGALEMVHDTLQKSSYPSVRRLAREIIALRRMLGRDGFDMPEYSQYDGLFSL